MLQFFFVTREQGEGICEYSSKNISLFLPHPRVARQRGPQTHPARVPLFPRLAGSILHGSLERTRAAALRKNYAGHKVHPAGHSPLEFLRIEGYVSAVKFLPRVRTQYIYVYTLSALCFLTRLDPLALPLLRGEFTIVSHSRARESKQDKKLGIFRRANFLQKSESTNAR